MTAVLPSQVEEAPEVYAWAAKRNMPVIIAPSMQSGPRSISLTNSQHGKDPANAWIHDLYVAVYSRAIEEGITTIEHLQHESISAYAGTSACNQVANGLFMRLNGQIKMCPGTSDAETIYGNVHDTSLAKLWMQSHGYAMGRIMNNWCQAKTTGLPESLQGEILQTLETKYRGRT